MSRSMFVIKMQLRSILPPDSAPNCEKFDKHNVVFDVYAVY